MDPALGSTSPPCVFGLSLKSGDDRPLLSMMLDSAEIVQDRRALFSFRLEEEESAIVEGMWR